MTAPEVPYSYLFPPRVVRAVYVTPSSVLPMGEDDASGSYSFASDCALNDSLTRDCGLNVNVWGCTVTDCVLTPLVEEG
jgi:hypothetical protein